VLDYLIRYNLSNHKSPTTSEIQAQFGLRSPGTVYHLLSALESDGAIRRIPHARRGIEIIRPPDMSGDCEIPMLGIVAAGYPIEAVLHQETIDVPRDLHGKGRTFALRVRGDSMSGDHIADGDYLIVESRETAENGQTVIAIIDGDQATVKRFYRERGRIRLEPANTRFKPIYVKPPSRLAIQGVVIGIIRKYPRGGDRHER
jgi:repressor LexA